MQQMLELGLARLEKLSKAERKMLSCKAKTDSRKWPCHMVGLEETHRRTLTYQIYSDPSWHPSPACLRHAAPVHVPEQAYGRVVCTLRSTLGAELGIARSTPGGRRHC